jgi:hypothetical protein
MKKTRGRDHTPDGVSPDARGLGEVRWLDGRSTVQLWRHQFCSIG